MALKPSTAKVIDLDTALDASPVDSTEGPIVWATVTIEYTLAGLNPAVSIRVPVPWRDTDGADQRRAEALRSARMLIEHACRAAGVGPQESGTADDMIEDVIAAVTPSGLEGIAQELGLTKPATKPRTAKR